MKRNISLDLISLLLILLFVYTASSKLILFDNFRFVLGQTDDLKPFAPFLSIFIPSIELVISILLLINSYRKLGLYMAFGLMLAFTLYVTYLTFYAPHRPCACGGAIKGLTWKQHITFNLFFTILAAVGIWIQKSSSRRQTDLSKVNFS